MTFAEAIETIRAEARAVAEGATIVGLTISEAAVVVTVHLDRPAPPGAVPSGPRVARLDNDTWTADWRRGDVYWTLFYRATPEQAAEDAAGVPMAVGL